jgi:hypothetical protein
MDCRSFHRSIVIFLHPTVYTVLSWSLELDICITSTKTRLHHRKTTAPTNTMASCYYNNYGQRVCNRSTWSNWARWLVLGLIILGAIFIFFLFS